jgi:hypothetical protein
MICDSWAGVLVTAEITPVTEIGNLWLVWPSPRQYVQLSVSLVSPNGCSHVEVAGADGLDGFGGGLITEQVAMGWVGNALNASGLLLCVDPALARLVKIVKAPMAGIDAVLQGAADRGQIKGLVHKGSLLTRHMPRPGAGSACQPLPVG